MTAVIDTNMSEMQQQLNVTAIELYFLAYVLLNNQSMVKRVRDKCHIAHLDSNILQREIRFYVCKTFLV
jgi:hypothetical protein